jgi:hypothetical protein
MPLQLFPQLIGKGEKQIKGYSLYHIDYDPRVQKFLNGEEILVVDRN